MKLILIIVIAGFAISCKSSNQKENSLQKDSLSISESSNSQNGNTVTLESFANSILNKEFNSLNFDYLLKDGFTVKKEVEESEGVEWDSYNLYKDKQIMVKIENNWENKKNTSRITFNGSYYKTTSGISTHSHYKDVKSLINTEKLNTGADGSLVLFDKQFPLMAYVFEVAPNSKIYNGVTNISDIPDTLPVTSIVVFSK